MTVGFFGSGYFRVNILDSWTITNFDFLYVNIYEHVYGNGD